MRKCYPQALLLDMDGVLFHGELPLPDASDFLKYIAHLPHAFITNNPIRTQEQIVEGFVRMGLPRPDPALIVTSALATADWLARSKPNFRYFAIGAVGLQTALAQVGKADAERADYVVIGEGPGLDYEQITIGINLVLKRGARLVVTNPDTMVDAVRDGQHLLLPGGGALVAPFAVATRVTPTVIGKPEPLLFEMALARLGCDAQHCLMIGDRPDTDIDGAARLGMWTALVRTGRFPVGAAWPKKLPYPDLDVESLTELGQRLARFPGLLGAGGIGMRN